PRREAHHKQAAQAPHPQRSPHVCMGHAGGSQVNKEAEAVRIANGRIEPPRFLPDPGTVASSLSAAIPDPGNHSVEPPASFPPSREPSRRPSPHLLPAPRATSPLLPPYQPPPIAPPTSLENLTSDPTQHENDGL